MQHVREAQLAQRVPRAEAGGRLGVWFSVALQRCTVWSSVVGHAIHAAMPFKVQSERPQRTLTDVTTRKILQSGHGGRCGH